MIVTRYILYVTIVHSVFSATIGKPSVIRTEKAKLLRGLQLTDRPQPFGDVFWRSERNIPYHEEWPERGTEKVTLRPVKNEGYCMPVDSDQPIDNCYTFQMQSVGSLISADLVLNVSPALRKENISLMIYEVSTWGPVHKLIEKMNVFGSYSTEDLTLKIDIRNNVQSWFNLHQTVSKLIQIDSKVNGERADFTTVFSQRPTVDLAFAKKAEPRCDRQTPCCLLSFYVNFTEIGWQDWILSPPGYWANVCVGQCGYNDKTPTQKLLRGARTNNTAFSIPAPQCAPLQFAPLTIIWAADPNDQRQTVLHGMRAMSCSCFSH